MRTADNITVASLNKAKAQSLDSNLNINRAMIIKAKIVLEYHLRVPKSLFTTYITTFQNKPTSLEQQGFGMSHSGIHIKLIKHLRKK